MVIGQSSKIIGVPIEIGSLEVAQNDFPKGMAWSEARRACANLGSGWRLPTKDELNFLYINQKKIGGFGWFTYWSSMESDYDNAWAHRFGTGIQDRFNKNIDFNVRAVRSF
jgi:hypothetical protein